MGWPGLARARGVWGQPIPAHKARGIESVSGQQEAGHFQVTSMGLPSGSCLQGLEKKELSSGILFGQLTAVSGAWLSFQEPLLVE